MSKIKVLHYIPTFRDCSIYRIVRNIVTHLDEADYEWHIGAPAPYQEGIDDFQSLGTHTTTFSPEGRNGTRRAIWQSSRNVRNYIQQHGIDLVHTHNATTTVTTWMAARDLKNVRRVYTKHLLTYPKDRDLGWIFTIVDRISMYQADHIIPVSKTMQKAVLAHIGISEKKSQPIQNSIDTEYFHAPEERESCRAEFNFEPDHIVIGFTGRLEIMKRLDLLLDSFATVYRQAPQARLLLAGVGSLEDSLKAQAKSLGIEDGVVWAGWRSDIPRLLAAMDIYAQSSSNEGLSLSILEAMAAAKAIVATEVGGIHEIIQSAETGTVIPPENQAALSQALLNFVQNPDLLKHTGQAAREFITTHFGVQRMTASYDAMYKQQIAALK